MKHTFNILIIAYMALVLMSCSNNKKQENKAVVTEEIPNVEVAEAVMAQIVNTEDYTSTVQANAVYNIAPMTGVRIEKINAQIGDYVTAGQVLVEAGTIKREQAELKFKNDGVELERLKGLYEKGGVSKSDLDNATLAYNVSAKNLADLQKNTIVTAPVSGVITAKNFEVGDVYAGGQPVLVLQQITPVKLLLGVSETDYTKVKKGDKVKITVDALPQEEFEGKINKIYPSIDVATHTVPVEVIVANTNKKLKPGMYAKVQITFGVNNSVVVPDAAVVRQLGSAQRGVYKLNADGTVDLVLVDVGRQINSQCVIKQGISEGDVVVVKGNTNLKSGEKVKVVNK